MAAAGYAEHGSVGTRRYIVAQIAAEFSVTRPAIYRHLPAPEANVPRPVDDSPADDARDH